MTTYAKPAWYEDEDTFPYMAIDNLLKQWPCTEEWYECWQPECIEGEEFNLVIMLNCKPVLVRGCHFDFEESK